jgi:hypothetical protein
VCKYCGGEFQDVREHEDCCAPDHVIRYMCPSYEGAPDCCYFATDRGRAEHHARPSNRRQLEDPDDGTRCPVLNRLAKPMSESVDEVVVPARLV